MAARGPKKRGKKFQGKSRVGGQRWFLTISKDGKAITASSQGRKTQRFTSQGQLSSFLKNLPPGGRAVGSSSLDFPNEYTKSSKIIKMAQSLRSGPAKSSGSAAKSFTKSKTPPKSAAAAKKASKKSKSLSANRYKAEYFTASGNLRRAKFKADGWVKTKDASGRAIAKNSKTGQSFYL